MYQTQFEWFSSSAFFHVDVSYFAELRYFYLRYFFAAKKKVAEKSKQNYIESQSNGKAVSINNVWMGVFFVGNENGKELIKLRSIVFISCGTVANWISERLYAAHCALILLLFLRTDSKVADPLCHFHHWNVHIHLFYYHVNGLAKYTHTLIHLHVFTCCTALFWKHKRNQEGKIQSGQLNVDDISER